MQRIAAVFLLALAACGGGDAAGPAPVETYAVELGSTAIEDIDGVLYIDGTFRVRDGSGTRIEGALVRVEVTAGTVTAGPYSGAGGLVAFSWALPGGDAPATLRACASNSTAPCTTWTTVVTVEAS